MVNYIIKAKAHYTASLELGAKNPTWWKAVYTVLLDIIICNRRTIQFDDGSHVVYSIIKKPLHDIVVAYIIGIYVPKSNRHSGVASELLDKIPHDVVINGKGKVKIGELYVR